MIMVNAVNTIPPVLITLSHANARFSLSSHFVVDAEQREREREIEFERLTEHVKAGVWQKKAVSN